MRVIGTIRATGADEAAVRVEDVFATDVDDLWAACTEPERLARWVAEVSGDLTVGGAFRARFTSGWQGSGDVRACKPPRRLLIVTREEGTGEEHEIEAILTPEGADTRLTVEERRVPRAEAAAYGAGWQIHLEDLAATLAGNGRCDPGSRWGELIGAYRGLPVG